MAIDKEPSVNKEETGESNNTSNSNNSVDENKPIVVSRQEYLDYVVDADIDIRKSIKTTTIDNKKALLVWINIKITNNMYRPISVEYIGASIGFSSNNETLSISSMKPRLYSKSLNEISLPTAIESGHQEIINASIPWPITDEVSKAINNNSDECKTFLTMGSFLDENGLSLLDKNLPKDSTLRLEVKMAGTSECRILYIPVVVQKG